MNEAKHIRPKRYMNLLFVREPSTSEVDDELPIYRVRPVLIGNQRRTALRNRCRTGVS